MGVTQQYGDEAKKMTFAKYIEINAKIKATEEKKSLYSVTLQQRKNSKQVKGTKRKRTMK